MGTKGSKKGEKYKKTGHMRWKWKKKKMRRKKRAMKKS